MRQLRFQVVKVPGVKAAIGTAIQAMCWLILVRSGMIKCRNVCEGVLKLTAVCCGQRLSYTEGCKEGRGDCSERMLSSSSF